MEGNKRRPGIGNKVAKRLNVLSKVGSSARGFESRILAVTVHSLIESIINYGLAATGTHVDAYEMRRIDTQILNRAARKVVGTNITMRIESLMMLADLNGVMDHYIVKNACLMDRIMRARGTAAQDNAPGKNQQEYWTAGTRLWNWKDATQTQI